MYRKDAIEHFGSPTNLAKALAISTSAVYQWGDIVPEGTAYKLQVITAGALQVDQALYGKPKVPVTTG